MDTTNHFTQKKLRIKVADGFNFIDKDNIVRIEVNNKKIFVYLTNPEHDISTYDSLVKIERQLEERQFFCCHRAHIINMDYVVKYVPKIRQIVTARGIVPLAESRAGDFNRTYLK